MDGKLNIGMAKLQLRTLCLTREAIHLIVDCAIVRHATNTGVLVMHDLNKFHQLIDQSNLHGIGCLDFSISKRKNLSYDALTSSLMHILHVGMQKFILC